MDLTLEEYLEQSFRFNLYLDPDHTEPNPIFEAFGIALPVVLCGREVHEHFGLSGEFLDIIEADGVQYLLFPHPSGLNRWWNSEENCKKAKKKLKEFIGG